MTYSELKDFVRRNRTLKDIHSAHRTLDTFSDAPFRTEARVALLTSYTIDFIVPLLKTELLLNDIRCEVYKPHFNQFRQELLNPESGLYRFRPNVTIVGFGLEDIAPDAVSHFPLLSREQRQGFRRQVLETCESLLESFRHNEGPGSLLLQDFIVPIHVFDLTAKSQDSLHHFVAALNSDVREITSRYPNVHLLEYSCIAAACGTARWVDPRTYYTAHIPVAQDNWIPLAERYAAQIRAAMSQEVKCVVLDLDNTLWGGVLGEDGFDGIRLGETYPGNIYRRFQEYLLGLYANGYILAISSKNDPDDVMNVLRNHPGMILHEQHFACIMANWNPKEANILAIAKEIQISPDHMLFVDDNPVEIGKVEGAIPGITCLHLEAPPLRFAEQFREARCFGKLSVTEEDKERGRQYFDDRQRREFRQHVDSLDDFYRSLEQKLTLHVNHTGHRARIAQLSQRTNQFNMATLRLTESEVEAMLLRPDYELVTADLRDRFGDSGTVAYVQVRKTAESWEIENFLMSCRVLGRTVDDTLLGQIIERAKSAGAENVVATYTPTKKNAPFADFYARNGFAVIEESPPGGTRYALKTENYQPRPVFLDIIDGAAEASSLVAHLKQ